MVPITRNPERKKSKNQPVLKKSFIIVSPLYIRLKVVSTLLQLHELKIERVAYEFFLGSFSLFIKGRAPDSPYHLLHPDLIKTSIMRTKALKVSVHINFKTSLCVARTSIKRKRTIRLSALVARKLD